MRWIGSSASCCTTRTREVTDSTYWSREEAAHRLGGPLTHPDDVARLKVSGRGPHVMESDRQLCGDLFVRADVPVQHVLRPRGHLRLLPGDAGLQHPRR